MYQILRLSRSIPEKLITTVFADDRSCLPEFTLENPIHLIPAFLAAFTPFVESSITTQFAGLRFNLPAGFSRTCRVYLKLFLLFLKKVVCLYWLFIDIWVCFSYDYNRIWTSLFDFDVMCTRWIFMLNYFWAFLNFWINDFVTVKIQKM